MSRCHLSFKTDHWRRQVLGLKDPVHSSKIPEGMEDSNLSECLKSFKNIGYAVIWMVVDPKGHHLPSSRPRIHFQGLDEMKLGRAAAKSHLETLNTCWSRLAAGVISERSLDDFLLSEEDVKRTPVYSTLSSEEVVHANWSCEMDAPGHDLKYTKIHLAICEQHEAMEFAYDSDV